MSCLVYGARPFVSLHIAYCIICGVENYKPHRPNKGSVPVRADLIHINIVMRATPLMPIAHGTAEGLHEIE